MVWFDMPGSLVGYRGSFLVWRSLIYRFGSRYCTRATIALSQSILDASLQLLVSSMKVQYRGPDVIFPHFVLRWHNRDNLGSDPQPTRILPTLISSFATERNLDFSASHSPTSEAEKPRRLLVAHSMKQVRRQAHLRFLQGNLGSKRLPIEFNACGRI